MTAKTRERIAVFGRNGVIVTSGMVIGAVVMILTGGDSVVIWGQKKFVEPVVEKRTAAIIDNCRAEVRANRNEMKECTEKQNDINQKILDQLRNVEIATAELRTEARLLRRSGR